MPPVQATSLALTWTAYQPIRSAAKVMGVTFGHQQPVSHIYNCRILADFRPQNHPWVLDYIPGQHSLQKRRRELSNMQGGLRCDIEWCCRPHGQRLNRRCQIVYHEAAAGRGRCADS